MKTKDYYDIAVLLSKLAEKYNYSKISIQAKPEDEFFNEACNYINLVAELYKMAESFKSFGEYRKILGRE